MVLSLRTLRGASLWVECEDSFTACQSVGGRTNVRLSGENMGFASQNRHFHNAKQAFLERKKAYIDKPMNIKQLDKVSSCSGHALCRPTSTMNIKRLDKVSSCSGCISL